MKHLSVRPGPVEGQTRRILAAFLTASMILPSPVFALREPQEEHPLQLGGLEVALRSGNSSDSFDEQKQQQIKQQRRWRDALRQIPGPFDYGEILDTVQKRVSEDGMRRRGLTVSQKLHAVVQDLRRLSKEMEAMTFSWGRDIHPWRVDPSVGLRGNRAFLVFRLWGTPVAIWFGQDRITDVLIEAEAVGKQFNLSSLFGGKVGPDLIPPDFHPEETSEAGTHGMTFLPGHLADGIQKRNGRIFAVWMGKNKKEVVRRLAAGERGIFEGNLPVSVLRMIPERVTVYLDREANPGEEWLLRLEKMGMTVHAESESVSASKLWEDLADRLLNEWGLRADQGETWELNLVTGSTPGKTFLPFLIEKFKALPVGNEHQRGSRIHLLHHLRVTVPDDYAYDPGHGTMENIPPTRKFSAVATRTRDLFGPLTEDLPKKQAELLRKKLIQEMVYPKVGQVEAQFKAQFGWNAAVLTSGPDGHLWMSFAEHGMPDVKIYDPRLLERQSLGMAGQKRVLLIENSAEKAGKALETLPKRLRQKGIRVEVIRPYRLKDQYRIPWDPKEMDVQNLVAVGAFGGPPNAHQVGTVPWLWRERRFLNFITAQQIPALLICLACQLETLEAGGQVTPDIPSYPEHGPRKLRFAGDQARQAPLLQGMTDEQLKKVMMLHGDAIGLAGVTHFRGTDLPVQTLLTGEDPTVLQAFAVGPLERPSVYAFLGHIPDGYDPTALRSWLNEGENEAHRAVIEQRIGEINRQGNPSPKIQATLLDNWWNLVESRWQERQTAAGMEGLQQHLDEMAQIIRDKRWDELETVNDVALFDAMRNAFPRRISDISVQLDQLSKLVWQVQQLPIDQRPTDEEQDLLLRSWQSAAMAYLWLASQWTGEAYLSEAVGDRFLDHSESMQGYLWFQIIRILGDDEASAHRHSFSVAGMVERHPALERLLGSFDPQWGLGSAAFTVALMTTSDHRFRLRPRFPNTSEELKRILPARAFIEDFKKDFMGRKAPTEQTVLKALDKTMAQMTPMGFPVRNLLLTPRNVAWRDAVLLNFAAVFYDIRVHLLERLQRTHLAEKYQTYASRLYEAIRYVHPTYAVWKPFAKPFASGVEEEGTALADLMRRFRESEGIRFEAEADAASGVGTIAVLAGEVEEAIAGVALAQSYPGPMVLVLKSSDALLQAEQITGMTATGTPVILLDQAGMDIPEAVRRGAQILSRNPRVESLRLVATPGIRPAVLRVAAEFVGEVVVQPLRELLFTLGAVQSAGIEEFLALAERAQGLSSQL